MQVRADAREHAARLAAGSLDLRALAAQAVHIGCRATQVRDGAGETLDLVADVFQLLDDGVFRTALDDAAFVLGDGAEGAAAKTAAHDVDRGTNHLPSRNLGGGLVAAVLVGVGRVRATGIGQTKHPVHLGGSERDGRWVHPNIARRGAFAMGLHQGTGVAGVGLQVQHAVGMGIENRVALDLFITRQAQHRAVARRHLGFVAKREVGHKRQGLHI